MELQFIDSSKKVKLEADIFGLEFKEALIHQAVTSYMSSGRAGTVAQKTRSEVSGGGIKPWRQKGTGRARAGSIRSPLWRKGGVIHAAKPRSYKQKMNKKAHRVAMCSILSELIRQNRMLAVEALTVETHKTKDFIKMINVLLKDEVKAGFVLGKTKLLLITDTVDENLMKACRNMPFVAFRDSMSLDPVVLVDAEKVLVTKAALKNLEDLLK